VTPELFTHPGFHLFAAGLDEVAVARAARLAGCEHRLADLSAVGSRDELLAALRATFELPGYVRRNWDSLDEALRDLGWLERRPRVLTIRGWSDFDAAQPEMASMLLRVLCSAIAAHAETAAPLHVVVI
jgi:hypothetical protein